MSKSPNDQMQQVVSSAEDVADNVLRRSKHYLPHIARLCLVATFLEDGVRMWFQWGDQSEYIHMTWGCGYFLAYVFVLINMIGQLAGCVMVLIRKQVKIAVGLLFGIVVIQTFAYTVLWDFKFFMRNLALSGSLLLLLAEASAETKTMFAGLPSMGKNQQQSYMQLAGRILVIFMFISLFKMEWTVLRVLLMLICTGLIICVAVGFKTKLAALVLVVLLSAINVFLNAFWMVPDNRYMRDFLKYDFFQTLSVIGGLLFVVALGPGGMSFDEHKKE